MMENQSPVPSNVKAQELLSFPAAIEMLIEGKRITRIEWGSDSEYGMLQDERLMIHTKGKDHLWIVSEADMRATDWVVMATVN